MCNGCWHWLDLLSMNNPNLLQTSLWAEIPLSIFMECLQNIWQYSEFQSEIFGFSKNCRQEWFFFSIWKLIVDELNSFITKLHIDIFVLTDFEFTIVKLCSYM
jgi:hypothetical protein